MSRITVESESLTAPILSDASLYSALPDGVSESTSFIVILFDDELTEYSITCFGYLASFEFSAESGSYAAPSLAVEPAGRYPT